jgi:two-component system response regulator FixJ
MLSPPVDRIVHIIDDDEDVRLSLQMLLRSAGLDSTLHASAADFLDAVASLEPGCLLVDLRMPDMDGMQLVERLVELRLCWPAVVRTGHGDVPTAVAAIQRGAADFLEKPFDEPTLLAALERGFGTLEAQGGGLRAALQRLSSLTPRERDALEGLVRGESTKEMARRLELSPRTAEMHRARLMKKLGAPRIADVLAIASAAGYRLGSRT